MKTLCDWLWSIHLPRAAVSFGGVQRIDLEGFLVLGA